jgi:hypothetical protein
VRVANPDFAVGVTVAADLRRGRLGGKNLGRQEREERNEE